MTCSKLSLVSSTTGIDASDGWGFRFDSLTDRGFAGQRKISPRHSRFGTDGKIDAAREPDHPEQCLANRLVAREQPVQVVHARNRVVAEPDDEVALAKPRLFRGAVALDLDHPHAALALQREMPHVAPR